jgi:hypothetical protein
MKNIPNFLLIGAPKAGTTAISAYLSEHPEIVISEEKEPFYFIKDIVRTIPKSDPMRDIIFKKTAFSWGEYLELFKSQSGKESLFGEATVHYLYHYKTVIPKVLKELGNIPIVIVLRNPIERAFSNYLYQSSVDQYSFEESLSHEVRRKADGWNSFWLYKETGLYCKPVEEFLKVFNKVHIVFYEDFKDNNLKCMQDVYSFLEVDSNFEPDIGIKHNVTSIPRNKLVSKIYYYIRKYNVNTSFFSYKVKRAIRSYLFTRKKNTMSLDIEKELSEYYANDICCLEDLINKDLSKWKVR